MQIIKTAVAAALATLAFSASAMTPIQDTELSTVSGQDGVSIVANLNIKIDSFTYTDTDVADPTTHLGAGGSIAFNGIQVNGLIAASIDILSKNSFLAAAGAARVTNPGTFYSAATGGDVVQIAIPTDVVATGHYLNVSVDSIKMGNSTASFGSVALNQIDMRGTSVWIFAH